MSAPRVHNKQEVIAAIADAGNTLERFGVRSVGLFGSFLRDEAQDDSDVDLLVDFFPDKKNFDNFMDLAFYLENLLGREVEVVTPQSLSKYIGPHILKEIEYVYPART
jgi:predicted nucleotidyltransferase